MRPNIQGEGEAFLQGVWKQDSVPMQDKRLAYTLYEMKFTCDSVYISMDMVNKALLHADSCTRDTSWKEYAKGVYIVHQDTLMIEAYFTQQNGRYKQGGCYRTGQYLPKFSIFSHNADSLVLREEYTNKTVSMKKRQDITCVPQPL
ncbi:fumarate hydratase [Olivibacter sitiensis]|uniref:fumarate hydratase n=1 Tax=Olivibacter sitiensis TaxID=376470 RepID=UPI000407D339|nr:fumarate hydratase [Olivibacter sitiensis]